jgi:imidazolonepropionase-like amidohydrolase
MDIVDLKRKVVLPGLIDCHVHLDHDASADPYVRLLKEKDGYTALRMADNARRTLLAGVTTVRDLGSKNGVTIQLRDAISAGFVTGPTVMAAGSMICITGGHGWRTGTETDGCDGVRRTVRRQIKEGADVIKFMATGGVLTPGVDPMATQFTLEELKIGVETADLASRKTAAHAMGGDGIRNALLAGIHSIEHGVFLDRELLDLMLEKDVFLVPTLSAPVNILNHGKEAGMPGFVLDKTKRVAERHFRSVQMAREAGVKIACGTDAGTPFNRHGKNAGELLYLVQNGFSEGDAIRSSTSLAAQLLGLEERIGSISPGLQADFIVLKKDPLKDITSLAEPKNIVAVYKAGKEFR